MRGLLALLLLVPSAAFAETPVVVSSAPDSVSVTIYRDNSRSAMNFRWKWEFADDEAWEEDRGPPAGFALIDEVRTIDLPPGEVTVRFEGVAGGIEPASAILFEADLAEKNFDARLLSERGLIDAFTGQSVIVRRTDPASGAVTTERGTIMSHPDGLVLYGPAGYEGIICDGNYTDLLFPGVPLDLTARPTLSMTTRPDQPGGRIKLRLAYLAANFDWEATYVAKFSPDGGAVTLSGWLSLESGDKTSFIDATTSAVAGTVFRAGLTEEEQEAAEEAREEDPYGPANIEVGGTCWPMGRTSGANHFMPDRTLPSFSISMDGLAQVRGGYGFGGAGCDDEECESIVVTGSRIIGPATIGDLKFYRIPHPTTVAAQSKKQVSFLGDREIEGELVILARVSEDNVDDGRLVFRFANEKRAGLGVPLPLGGIVMFQETRAGRQLLGPAFIRDKAVGEDVEIEIDDDTGDEGMDFDLDEVEYGDDWTKQELTVENDNEYPVTVEVELQDTDEYKIGDISQRTFRRDGARVWRIEVPPEDERTLRFTSTELPYTDWEDY